MGTHLYSSPFFDPYRRRLFNALLTLLLSRLYAPVHLDLIDTLYGLAAANWSDFHLMLLPAYVEGQLGALGPARGQLLGGFGMGDMGAAAFEAKMSAFANDVAFLQWSAA